MTLSSTAVAVDNSASAGPLLLIPQTQPATTDLAANTVTGSYMMVLVDIDYKVAQTVDYDGDDQNDTYKAIDLFPRPSAALDADQTAGEGYYAWVAIPVNINWTAGYKYTYTLNFTNYAVGKTSPVQPDDPNDPTIPDNPVVPDPDEPIVPESLTPLTFTVTVEDTWQEANTNVTPM